MNEDVRVVLLPRLTLNDALEGLGVDISDVAIGNGSLYQVLTW